LSFLADDYFAGRGNIRFKNAIASLLFGGYNMADTCNSCKKLIANMRGSVNFKCPNCSKYDIIRCTSCRKLATKYVCPECNFEGPN